MTSILSAEERDELATIMDAVLAKVKGTGARADLLHRHLLDAEQAQRPMATEVLYQATLVGLAKLITEHAKRKSTAVVTVDEAHVVKSLIAGIRRKRDDGTTEFQQTLYADCTWDEIAQALDLISGMLGSLGIRRKMLRRLQDLHEAAPDSRTVGEAVSQVGTTLEAWMEAA